MARRATPERPERPRHTVDEKRQDIVRIQRRIQELEAFEPRNVASRFKDPGVVRLQAGIASTLEAVFGENTAEYRRYAPATRLDRGPVAMSSGWLEARGGLSHDDRQLQVAYKHLSAGKAESIALLRQAVQSLEEEIEFDSRSYEVAIAIDDIPAAAQGRSRKVFVVHGHDRAVKEGLARFLEKIELEAIILHEQPDQGRTIIEKFEECASQVGFAVVLLTPDDLGAAKGETAQRARARQNVIFELGYFAGKLGRGKTCLLRQGNVEIPSDLYGVIYTDLDENDGWKMKLVRELKAAGLAFDANKVWE